MKKTSLFLFLAIPAFAEMDLLRGSEIPLRGSILSCGEDGHEKKLLCSLSNESDRDWLVCVDESGAIQLKRTDIDNDDASTLHTEELEDFPPDVRWVRRFGPKWTGLCIIPCLDPYSFLWQADVDGGSDGRLVLPVRAIDWRRYVRTVAPTNETPSAIDPANRLRWGIDVHGSNLVLTVENPSDVPVLLHVGSNDRNERLHGGYKVGPFDLGGELRAPRPRLFLVQFGWVSACPESGLYRVLHGQSAPSELRAASFDLIGIDDEGWKPGDKLSCSLKLYPRIVSPAGKRSAVDEPFRSGEVAKCRKLTAKLVFGPDGWRVESVR